MEVTILVLGCLEKLLDEGTFPCSPEAVFQSLLDCWGHGTVSVSPIKSNAVGQATYC